MPKYAAACVNAWNTSWVTRLGASPKLQLRSGPPEASVTATATGILVVGMTLPSSPFTSSSGGVVTKNGSWSGASATQGVIGHARMLTNDETACEWVGSVSQGMALSLTVDVASGNVVTVADTTGAVIGSGVVGVGVQAGTLLADKTSTTLTLSKPLTTARSIGDYVVVGDVSGDMIISGAYVPSAGFTVTVAAFSHGWPRLI